MENKKPSVIETTLLIGLLSLPNLFMFVVDLVFIYRLDSMGPYDLLFTLVVAIFMGYTLLTTNREKLSNVVTYVASSSGFILLLIIIVLMFIK